MQLLDGPIDESTGGEERFLHSRSRPSPRAPARRSWPAKPPGGGLPQRERESGLVEDVAGLGLVRAVGRRPVRADVGAELPAEVVVDHPVVRALRALLAVERVCAAREE